MDKRDLGKRPALLPDDAEILKHISEGDLQHFDIFVDRHKDRLLGYVRHSIGDMHRAEDITQEVFLRAFRAARRGRYRGDASASTWLFSIARNCVTDHFRASARDKTLLQNHQIHSGPASGLMHDRHHAQSEGNESPAPIVAAGGMAQILARLPEPQREVLVMKLFSELTFAEIAEVVGQKLPTVKSRMRYALEKVRELLIQAGSLNNG